MTEKKLILFDLDRAIAGDPLVTRDGRKIIKFHYFACDDLDRPIVAHIENDLRLSAYYRNGKYYPGNCDCDCECDLFMAPKIKTYWVNIYKIGSNYSPGTVIYSDEKTAKENKVKEYIKTISFEMES